MPKYSPLWFCWLILLFTANVYAQTPQLERLSTSEGLSQGMIYDLLQDQQGFLWFATKSGLNRYDGYSFKIFQNNPFDPFSIAGNDLKVMLEDRLGRIWAGTSNNGLTVLDPKTGRFYHFNHCASPNINCLAQTTDGAIWVGSTTGINRLLVPDLLPLDRSDLSGIIQAESIGLGDRSRIPDQIPVDLKGSKDGKLWISTKRQIGYLNPQSGQFQLVWTYTGSLPNQQLQSFFRESVDGAIWVGQTGQLLRIKGQALETFLLPETSVFPYTDLAFDASGNAYISTRKQIFKLINALQTQPGNAHFDLFYRFPENGLIGSTRLLIDRGGLLWIGTNGYGLRKYNPGNPGFHHYLAGTSPRRIVSDAQGRLWVWLPGSKFRRLGPNGAPAEMLHSDKKLLQHDCIQSRSGSIWLLCENQLPVKPNGVLVRINPQTLKEEARYLIPVNIGLYSQVFEDQHGMLWILGVESTLTRFDPATAQMAHFEFSGTTGFRESAMGFSIDQQGHFWIGTPHGLVQGLPATKGMEFKLYVNNPADHESMNCNAVLNLLEDPRRPELLWLGTNGGGLNQLDRHTGKFKHYTSAEGLPNNVVYAVLPDLNGALWLSTNNGLSKFDPTTKVFQNYFGVDGLQDNEFNTLSFARATDGQLFFGGVNGISAFYPADLNASITSLPVMITQLLINNQPIDRKLLENSIEQTHSITLDHTQSQLTIEFAAMDFSAPRMNQFKYWLKGINEGSMAPTVSNSATYAHLHPGTYIFEVQTGGSRGIWTNNTTQLTIYILPPWYQTYWAYAGYVLLFGLSVWGFYRFQSNRIHLKNKLAFEQREAQRLAELDGLKTNFFSSITHEFRTPLTLMLEPARQLLSDAKDRAMRYRLELIENNAQRLLNLVNQLLDLSKLEAGQMPLDLRPGNPAGTVRNVAEQFQSLARQRSINLETDLPEMPLQVVFDENKLDQVISNLVSNALKFTDQGGTVSLRLTEAPSFDPFQKQFLLEVSDTGIGIAPADLPRVFDRFYQTAHTRGGTGIGLSLTKELVEHMGGSISVESPLVNGHGTKFRVQFSAALSNHPATATAVAAATAPATATATATPPSLSSSEQPLLLLIEDDTELRHFLRASLPAHYRIAEAVDGEEGIQMAQELVPDLVISDLVMPRKDGFGVAEELKNNPGTSHIPLILLTAKSALESKVQGLRRGADVYLTKPFRAEELSAHIENLLRSRKQLQVYFSAAAQEQSVQESAVATFPVEENEFLQRLIRVVEENLDNEAMDAEGFARAMFISRSQLHRKISALTGLSLTEFVRNHRLDRARYMLAQREGSISEVAWRTGFANARYFATCFKERFGQTPSGFLAET